MQGVVRDIEAGDVMPDIGPAPLRQRVDLAAALAIWLDERHIRPVGRLLAAQAGDPGAAAGQHAAQGLELANAAAVLAQFDAVVHRPLAVGADKLDHLLARRAEDFNRQTVTNPGLVQQGQGLAMQQAGVERGQSDRQAVARDQVGDQHVLSAQRGRLQQARTMLSHSPLQHLEAGGQASLEAHRLARIQRCC